MSRITRLPVEILLQILEDASQSSNRNASLISLATTCKAFKVPALCVLFERLALQDDFQAWLYLTRIQTSLNPLGLASQTRRLSLSYTINDQRGEEEEEVVVGSSSEEEEENEADASEEREGEGEREREEGELLWDRISQLRRRRRRSNRDEVIGPVQGPIQALTAMRIFYLMKNLTHVKLEGDDEFKTLESAITRRRQQEEDEDGGGHGIRSGSGMESLLGRARVIKLLGKSLRWDRLICFISSCPTSLRELQVGGLYRAPQSLSVDRQRRDNVINLNDDGDEDEEEENDEEITSAQAGDSRRRLRSHTGTHSRGQLSINYEFPPSLDRSPSPLPEPPRSIPNFPRFVGLTRLRLDKPQLSDQHLLSIVRATCQSLEAFSLVESKCFSRECLIITLRNLPNLFELELINCVFFQDSIVGGIELDSGGEQEEETGEEEDEEEVGTRNEEEENSNETSILAPLSLPDKSTPLTSDLDPYTTTPTFTTNSPITRFETKSPLDYLALYCPFVHSLKLTTPPGKPSLVSDLFFRKVVNRLPLQYLTLGVTEQRRFGGVAGGALGAIPPGQGMFRVVGNGLVAGGGGQQQQQVGQRGNEGTNNSRAFSKELIVEMIHNLGGRLHALAITKEMMWEEFERNWVRDTCQNFGIVYTSEPGLTGRTALGR